MRFLQWSQSYGRGHIATAPARPTPFYQRRTTHIDYCKTEESEIGAV